MVEAYRKDGELFNSEDEKRRLSDTFPARISSFLLAEVMAGVDGVPRILDIACGPNPTLAHVVYELGRNYIGLDLDPNNAHLKNMMNDGVSNLVKGSALELPFKDAEIEITHTRAFLAFLPDEQRIRAIDEIVGVTKNSAIFIEHDYTNTAKWTGVAAELRDSLISVLTRVGFDPFYDQRLEDEVKAGLSKREKTSVRVDTRKIERKPGNYYQEMLTRAKEIVGVAEKLGCSDDVGIIEDVIRQLETGDVNELPYFKHT